MTPRWRTRREFESFMGTERAHSAKELANFWPRTLWLKNIRLRRKSTEERPLPSSSCRNRKREIRKEKLEKRKTSGFWFWRDADHAALLYSPRSDCQITTRCLHEKCEEFIAACKGEPGNRPVGSSDCGRHADFSWNGSHGQRAGARYEKDTNSGRSCAQRAHGGVAREPGHRNRGRQDCADRGVWRN